METWREHTETVCSQHNGDELEKAFAGVKGGDGDSGVTKRIFGNFLTWLSDRTADVFIVATANDVDSIPPAMLRGGRFDSIFWVDLPCDKQRMDILGIHLAKAGRSLDAITAEDQRKALIKVSKDFSGAEIEVWVNEALTHAYSQNHKDLTAEDLLETAKEITPVIKLMGSDIDKARQWAKSHGTKYASRIEEEEEYTQPGRKIQR